MADLDDTLVDRAGFFRQWCIEFSAEHAIPADALPWMLQIDDEGNTHRDDWLQQVKDRYSLSYDVADQEAAFKQVFYPRFRCDDATVQALSGLRAAGWRIAIVTNGGATQQDKIDAAGLEQHVDVICVSELVGFAKPDRRIFECAAERAGEQLSDAWMVGDNALKDVGGGRDAGVRTAWISLGRDWPLEWRPDVLTATFAAAVDAILRR